MKRILTALCLGLAICPAMAQGGAPPPAPPPPVPVCTWPDQVPVNFSVSQLLVLQAWATNQDYSHQQWQTIAPTLLPQLNELQKKHCK